VAAEALGQRHQVLEGIPGDQASANSLRMAG